MAALRARGGAAVACMALAAYRRRWWRPWGRRPPRATATFSNVRVTAVAPPRATIAWDTDIATDTQVAYGATTAYGSTTTLSDREVTAHSGT